MLKAPPRLMKAEAGMEEAGVDAGGRCAAAADASLALVAADDERRCFLIRRPLPPFSDPPDGVSVSVTFDVCPYLRKCSFKL